MKRKHGSPAPGVRHSYATPVTAELLIGGERVGPGRPLGSRPAEVRLAPLACRRSTRSTPAIAAAREAHARLGWTPALERGELLHEVATVRTGPTSCAVADARGRQAADREPDEVGWTAAAFDYYAEMGRNFAAGSSLRSSHRSCDGAQGADGRGRLHRAVELPAAAARLEARRPRWRPATRDRQAERADAAVHAALADASSTCRRAWSTWPRGRRRGRGDRGRRAGGLIAFTGSVETGKRIAHDSAERVARINLELGGKDPFIVCADVAAEIDVAARGGAWAAYLNSGQVCTSAERFYVEQSVYDDFLGAFVDHDRSLRVGDPLDAATDMGPMVSGAPGEGRAPARGGGRRRRQDRVRRRPCRPRPRLLHGPHRGHRRGGDTAAGDETLGCRPDHADPVTRRGDRARQLDALRARRQRVHARPADGHSAT